MAYDQRLADVEREAKGMEQEIADLRATGDLLQSAGSRLAEFVFGLMDVTTQQVPYEVHMAVLEARSAIDLWTEVRRGA